MRALRRAQFAQSRGALEQDPQLLVVGEAKNGQEALDRIPEAAPDIVLMDIVMPGQNGFQTTRQLSRDPQTQHIPIVMVTTKDQETDRVWAKRQGAREYLVKPVSQEELLKSVESLLEGNA